jgi:hypothetical protein
MALARLACVLAMAMAAGCQPSDDPHKLGPAKDIVTASLDAHGGLYALRHADSMSAAAVITIYDAQGRPHTDSASVQIDLARGVVTARQSPGAAWSASATADSCTPSGRFSTPDQRQRFCDALQLLAHRARGPMNLIDSRERPAGAARATVEGMDLVRVPVTGDNSHAIAYYFDSGDKTLRMVTSGADRPGRDGTVTTYEYQKVGQVLVPRRITVHRIGLYTLVGQLPIADIQLSDITVR